MPQYFNLSEFNIQHSDRTEPRFTEANTEWRLLCETNLTWLHKTLQAALQKPASDEERLGLACLFYFHLRAIHDHGPEDDLRPDLFPSPNGEF